MNILAVDDEALQLDKLTEAILEAVPEANVVSTRRPSQALCLAEETNFDIAFLDVQMRGMNGVELAILIKRVLPRINIIFVTAYNDYKADAMDLRASGYITKPVNAIKIKTEIENLRYPFADARSNVTQHPISFVSAGNAIQSADSVPPVEEQEEGPLLYVQCFGNFDVFDRNHKPIHFKRSKAKELLAYLVFKRGTRCTNRELVNALYENTEYSLKVQDTFRHVNGALLQALRDVGAEKVILREHQNYAVDKNLIDCDYYRFLKEDPKVRNNYTGEFMSQYSWAEYINAYLDAQL